MRGLTRTAILAALWMPTVVAAAETVPEQRRIFEDHGNLTAATLDRNGTLWLSLWEPHVRFHLAGESVARLQELKTLIERADESGQAVDLRYDGARGTVNRTTGTLEYPLCSIALDDRRFEPARPCETSAPKRQAEPGAALALANAHSAMGNDAYARGLLERGDFPADPVFRKLFLRVHARAETGFASTAQRASPEADRALVAALEDRRALAGLGCVDSWDSHWR